MFRLLRIVRKRKPDSVPGTELRLETDSSSLARNNSLVVFGKSLHSYFADVREELSGKVPNVYSTNGRESPVYDSEPVTPNAPVTPMDVIPELSRDSSFEMTFASAQPRELSCNTSAKNSMDTSFFETMGGPPVKRSFDVMLHRPSGLSAFEQQLKKEYSNELMDFFMEANAWRRCFDVIPKVVHEGNAKRICDKFIGNSAECAVNLPGYMVKELVEKINGGEFLEENLFDAAIQEAMKLMEQGPYMRFKGNKFA